MSIVTKRFQEGLAEGRAWAETHKSLGMQHDLMAKKRGYTGEERIAYLDGWTKGFHGSPSFYP